MAFSIFRRRKVVNWGTRQLNSIEAHDKSSAAPSFRIIEGVQSTCRHPQIYWEFSPIRSLFRRLYNLSKLVYDRRVFAIMLAWRALRTPLVGKQGTVTAGCDVIVTNEAHSSRPLPFKSNVI